MGCCSAGRLSSTALRWALPGLSRRWRWVGPALAEDHRLVPPSGRPPLPPAVAPVVPGAPSRRVVPCGPRPAGRPGPLRPVAPAGRAGRSVRGGWSAPAPCSCLAACSERSSCSGPTACSGRSVRSACSGPSGRPGRSGRSDRLGRSAKGCLVPGDGRVPLALPLDLGLPASAPAWPGLCEGPPGGRRSPPRSPPKRSPPKRSPPKRSPPDRLRAASCVVTPAVTGRSSSSMRLGSAVSGGRGGSTDTTVMPSIPKSASALTTSPAFAPLYRSDASSAPLGLRAPAARHVQVPSRRALVSSISIRRATAPKYNFGASAQITVS